VQYCLDHLTRKERAALQRDLDLASQMQRNLLPQKGLCVGGWETSYHFAPLGAVSGDYCDLIPSDGQLLFLLGDVSGKGVAASMLMAQLHALFRSLSQMALPLGEIVTHVNRIFCESVLAGQYAFAGVRAGQVDRRSGNSQCRPLPGDRCRARRRVPNRVDRYAAGDVPGY